MKCLTAAWRAVCLILAVCIAQNPVPAVAQGGNQTEVIPRGKGEISLTFAPLVREVGPAVVNVYTRTVVSERRGVSPLFDDPFFKRFFGDLVPSLPQRRREATSLGSGVIVDAAGTVVTNNHVIEGADEITVVLNDRREYKARLILADPDTDLAVLAIDGVDEPLPYVEIHDSDDLAVGDLVLAIGNPFGVGQTVTMGIVSALARTNVGITDYSFFIQTDASINPGNSGGALIGTDGRLVGINTAIYSNQRGGSPGGSVGIGFAVPSNMVATVLRAARDGGVVRPWLGARTQTVTADLADSLGMKRPVGALVNDLYPGGPAEQAGLQAGDVIVAVDGREVIDSGALRYRVATRAPGEDVAIRVIRGGAERDLSLAMVPPAEDPPAQVTDVTGRNPFAGSRVANLSPALAVEEGFDEMARGVVVLGLKRGSAADQIGVRRGDIVVRVNGLEIDSVATFNEAVASPRGGWELAIKRDGKVLTTRVQG
ncbi:Do family serine endopeptidase [Thalassobaculum litoreum]|uniref:Serine protease Do n=1 Tax=Thalassobaculum litoreum DSM 18839 TaxID=1123362 RepID=A0A8G2BM01_9PROT|nr:Do family serine endopeptidase [Thalassobaculum litoreum]SDG47323.1 serine protease Do [Thalassobaculum litoreum DSM 18839]